MTATNAAGTGTASAASGSVTPTAAIAKVREVTLSGSTNMTGKTSAALSLPAVTAGDTLVLAVADDHGGTGGGATVSAVTGGNVAAGGWTSATVQKGSANNGEVELWYGRVATTSASAVTVTVTLSVATNIQLADVTEWSGIAATSPTDGATGANGTGTAITAGPVTTTVYGDLVVSATWSSVGAATAQNSTTSGYTALSQAVQGTTYRGWGAYQTKLPVGAVSAAWSPPSSATYVTAIAAFNP